MKMQKQAGFTLIELVVVIVILGILAATAIPKFVNLSKEAGEAALDGVASSMTSAMALNYAGCVVSGMSVAKNKCEIVKSCENVKEVLQGGVPEGYAVKSEPAIGPEYGDAAICTVVQTKSPYLSKTFQAIRTAKD